MADKISSHHQTEDVKVSPAKGSKFFKIIFDPRSLRLRIPAEFMRRHGENMSNPVFLRVPTGSQMEVELLIHGDGDEAWLQKGWPEFRDFYGIGFGQFLVFEYNGNSRFDVLIFDMTACEIEYPDNYDEGLLDTHDVKPEENGYDSDSSIVFLEEIRANKKGIVEEKIPENSHGKIQMKKKIRARKDDDMQHCANDCTIRRSSVRGMKNPSSCSKTRGALTFKFSSLDINHSKRVTRRNRTSFDLEGQKECNGGNGRQGTSQKEQQVKRRVEKEKSIAYQKATAFMSEISSPNPFSVVLLQPSFVSNGFHLCLPIAFARENLPVPRQDLSLRVSDGKMWSVKYLIRSYSAMFTCGWKAFVEDNDLKLGDACVFEVVKGPKLLWNVFIFRHQ